MNLAQTKVNPGLAYDLYELARARSPQKTCHNIAVALDQHQKSPFYLKIKRLGVATEGRFNETLTQATLIKSLMPYVSRAPLHDRDILLRGGQLSKATDREIRVLIFRNEDDLKIVDVVWNYYEAIKKKWPRGWENTMPGNMLNRTNGLRGFMRFLRPAYLHVSTPGNVPSTEKYSELFEKTSLVV